jgi:hypothetical protein
VKKLVEPLIADTLEPLREWVDGLNEMVSDLEDAVATLASAERADRENAHATLTGDAGTLLSTN